MKFFSRREKEGAPPPDAEQIREEAKQILELTRSLITEATQFVDDFTPGQTLPARIKDVAIQVQEYAKKSNKEWPTAINLLALLPDEESLKKISAQFSDARSMNAMREILEKKVGERPDAEHSRSFQMFREVRKLFINFINELKDMETYLIQPR